MGSDSGVAAVETALVSMLLIILLYGVVESSFLFKDWLGVSAAARAGARMGASQPRSVSFAQDTADQVTSAMSDLTPANVQAVWVYKASDTTGLPSSGATCPTSCVKFSWPTGATKLTYLSGTWLNTSQNACAGDAARDSLGVYVKYQHTSPLRFFFNNQIMSESTVMWIEPISSSLICKP
jgi:Flp pilus assembly protein TadG